ncbi:unnamed protein product [Adineta ricciae]|uniref:PDZ domain-containing protein n=1 Tax=Adineta ricciae TaxID=249248 RepID=A0A814G4W2_ADIRI|nr:unnamed protein product [Adineta ricciae]CAF1576472.1 unnamed protein product [Adineta ricciae]
MLPRRIIRYALSPQTKILMDDQQHTYPVEILFEEQITLSDGYSKPHSVLLQLTSESLIIQPVATIPKLPLNKQDVQTTTIRTVTISRHPVTRSLGFWIKGGSDTGFPILISRVLDGSADLLNIGDAILSINDEDITNSTHDQVINQLHDTPGGQVTLTVKYMKEMATYLHLTTEKSRPSVLHSSLTLPRRYLIRDTQEQKRLSAEYPLEYRDDTNRQRWSLLLPDQSKSKKIGNYEFGYAKTQEYSLLYAYVTQYLNGTDKLRTNSFQVHALNGSQTGILIANTFLQQNMWISRINMVIRNLTTRILSEMNQTLLSNEQIFYTTWIHERDINPHENLLPQWKAIFLVFKGSDLHIFDENQSPPLRTYDFICCTRVYPLIEVFIETVSIKDCLDDRRYCFTLTLLNDTKIECRYLNFERKIEYDDFILNYQRSLYISVYSTQNRTFGCHFHGQICRLIIDVNKGFEMYNNQTNSLLWTYSFEQLHASSDNGRDEIYFQFNRHSIFDDDENRIHIAVQCQHLKRLIHVINSFLTVKFLGQKEDVIT